MVAYNRNKGALFLLSQFSEIVGHETAVNVANTRTRYPNNFTTTLPYL